MITFITRNGINMIRIGKYNWEIISQYPDGSGNTMYSIYFNLDDPLQFNYIKENKTLSVIAPYREGHVPVRFCCEEDSLETYVDNFLLANQDVHLDGTIYTIEPKEEI